MTPEDALEVMTKMAGGYYENTDGLRVHVRNRLEIIRRIGKPDKTDDLWSVAISGDVVEGVWFEVQDESLENAINILFQQMADAQGRRF